MVRSLRRALHGLTLCGTLVLVACSSNPSSQPAPNAVSIAVTTLATAPTTSAGGKIGVILPDFGPDRFGTADRGSLDSAITAAGFEPDIQSAENNTATMAMIADSMIAEGVKVLMIVDLDSDSGAMILHKANAAGIKTIDYDRLTLGGGADAYVSFDNVKVGTMQGEGLVKCITDKGVKSPKIAVLNGPATDYNATLFKSGYDAVITPKFQSGQWTLVDDHSVPDWDPSAARDIFQRMLIAAGGSVDGVLAANDDLGGAAIDVLKRHNLQVPVTGQDATLAGLRNVLAGDQCMTVYKAFNLEAQAAAAAAAALATGKTPSTNATTLDSKTGKDVPSIIIAPVAIYIDNVKDVVVAGFQKAANVCSGLEAQCAKADIK